eukprot:115167_1
MYVKAKYYNLKYELISNCLYKISKFEFESILSECQEYLQCYRAPQTANNDKRILLSICNIKPNTPITIDHVMSIMLYTNMDNLQREFKKGCRFVKNDTDQMDVKKRNKEIANWCRLVWESIRFFGKSMKESDVFYHGLNCKLLFDSVIAAFNCPTSTTVNKLIAYHFSTN